MVRRATLPASFALAGLAVAAHALAVQQSLADCVNLALASSPTVRIAAGRLEISRRLLLKAYGAMGPRVDFAASQALAGFDNAGNKLDELRWDDDTHQFSVNARWTVFNNLKDSRSAGQARLDREAGAEALKEVRIGLVARVWEAYYGQLLAKRMVAMRRQFLESQKEHVDITEKLYKSGVRSYADVLSSRVELKEKELSALNAELGERSARAALNVLMGRDPDYPLELEAAGEAVPEGRNLEADLQAALAARPEARRARIEAAKAKLGVRGAWAELFPALSLDASWRYRFDEPSVEVAPGVRVRAAQNPYWQVGARLDFTVFDGFQNWQDVKRAKLEEEIAREELEAVSRRISSELLNAHVDIEKNQKAYQMAKEINRTAEESLAIVLDQYRQGNASSLAVKDAQNSLLSLQESQAQALHGWHIARGALLQAMGTLGP